MAKSVLRDSTQLTEKEIDDFVATIKSLTENNVTIINGKETASALQRIMENIYKSTI